MMLVICGTRIVAQSFSSHVGSGPSEHCFDDDSLMVATTSSTVIRRKSQANGRIVDNEGWFEGGSKEVRL